MKETWESGNGSNVSNYPIEEEAVCPLKWYTTFIDLREDYCLGLLTQWGEYEKGFSHHKTNFSFTILETQGENFIGKDDVWFNLEIVVSDYEKEVPLLRGRIYIDIAKNGNKK